MSSEAQAAATTVSLLTIVAAFAGADIAPSNIVERMLWPQRHNNVSSTNFLKNTLLLSAGGPLHKTVLATLNSFLHHSLFKGAGKGHMLGTSIFPDTGLSYTKHSSDGRDPEQELVRNGLLVRALKEMPASNDENSTEQDTRQKITVTHLELTESENVPSNGAVKLDDDQVNLKTILVIALSELPTIILACFAAMIWRPAAASLFLAPLVLKVSAALSALSREDFVADPNTSSKSWPKSTTHAKFEIHVPGEGFQIISGPEELVLPFFRHYGHPIRCHWRETTQMMIVAALGLYNPLMLGISMVFMPLQVQVMWLVYQVYVCCTMLAVRYDGGELWGTTEERLGDALAQAELRGSQAVMIENRNGPLMMAKIKRTSHSSYSQGKARVDTMLSE